MIQKLDDWYKEWSGVSHLENSNRLVHDSAAAQDFARYCMQNALPDKREIDNVIEERAKNSLVKYTEQEIKLGKQAFRNGCSFVINRFLNGV